MKYVLEITPKQLKALQEDLKAIRGRYNQMSVYNKHASPHWKEMVEEVEKRLEIIENGSWEK